MALVDAVAAAAAAPQDDASLDLVQRYSNHPSAFLALNGGTEFFTAEGIPGFVAYRAAGLRWLVQFGGLFTPAEHKQELAQAWRAYAKSRHRRIVAVQLPREDAALLSEQGWTVNQFGSTFAVEVEKATLKGSAFMRLRNKISRARRLGVVVEEVGARTGIPGPTAEELDALDKKWLRAKGWHVKEITFMVGERGGPYDEHRRLFTARLGGELVGYISYSPVYGDRSGWMHDLSRRIPDGAPGILELVNATALETFRGEGVQWLHFGFTPFTRLADENEFPGNSGLARHGTRLLFDHGAFVYPAQTQLAYKEKWGQHLVEPEYLGFDGRLSVLGIFALLRLTNSI